MQEGTSLQHKLFLRKAAASLYVTQPALSASIRDLEEELGIQIFERSSHGISLTKDGEEFLDYAKQAVNRYSLIEERYLGSDVKKEKFSVSAQHYIFALNAFVQIVRECAPESYSFTFHEGCATDVLKNLRDRHSEIGVLSFSSRNERAVKKLLKDCGLCFTPIMKRDAYAYMWDTHPLAKEKELSLKDLTEYPCITFERQLSSNFSLGEEALDDFPFNKQIFTTDRASSTELVAKLNGYAIGTGLLSNGDQALKQLISVKLKEEDPLVIGFAVRKGVELSPIGKRYIAELLKLKEL